MGEKRETNRQTNQTTPATKGDPSDHNKKKEDEREPINLQKKKKKRGS
jgi:hypothetical protein